jgi:hypothetical protein
MQTMLTKKGPVEQFVGYFHVHGQREAGCLEYREDDEHHQYVAYQLPGFLVEKEHVTEQHAGQHHAVRKKQVHAVRRQQEHCPVHATHKNPPGRVEVALLVEQQHGERNQGNHAVELVRHPGAYKKEQEVETQHQQAAHAQKLGLQAPQRRLRREHGKLHDRQQGLFGAGLNLVQHKHCAIRRRKCIRSD